MLPEHKPEFELLPGLLLELLHELKLPPKLGLPQRLERAPKLSLEPKPPPKPPPELPPRLQQKPKQRPGRELLREPGFKPRLPSKQGSQLRPPLELPPGPGPQLELRSRLLQKQKPVPILLETQRPRRSHLNEPKLQPELPPEPKPEPEPLPAPLPKPKLKPRLLPKPLPKPKLQPKLLGPNQSRVAVKAR